MKILLLGDFSAVHVNLKIGLQQLGHEVILVSKGDGFKKLPADIRLYTRSAFTNKISGAFKEIRHQLGTYPLLKHFDVVQTASYQFFHNRIDPFLFKRVLDNNHRSVLLNTSCSVPYNQLVKQLGYSPCAQCKKFDLPHHTCVHENPSQLKKENHLYEKYSAIVSTHYEYHQAMEQTAFKQKNHFIPLPINTTEYQPVMHAVDGKVVIYYGEIRKGFKGGEHIEQALDKLATSKYANRVEIIRTSKIPFHDYLQVLDRAHILIDQANSYSYGMNALIGLSKGKIVLSGAEPESMQMMGETADGNPFFNIKPSKDHVFDTLVSLVEQTENFGRMSEKSRRFVEKHHAVDKVAAMYNSLYQQLK